MMKKFYILFIVLWSVQGWSQSVSLYNPGSGAAYPAEQFFCTGESFNLKVDAVATSTGDYKITKELPSSFPLSAGSTPINFQALNSNKFSESFPIGFTFSFYGKEYTRVVAGSNGRLVFTNDAELESLKDVAVYQDRTYSGIPASYGYSILPSVDYNKVYKVNPAQELNLAQIFFGYTDLIPRSQNGSVTYLYKNITVEGQNVLLVSYQNQIRTDGVGGFSGSEKYSSTILLFEDGRIVIYVNNKILDTYNAILGIQNEDASKFKVPTHSNAASNYNNGPWRSEGVAWVFTPNLSLTPQFKWLRNGAQITGETADTLTGFVPADGDVLKIDVTYHDTAGIQVGAAVSDQVAFKLLKTPLISTPNYATGCGNPTEIHVIDPDPALTYEWLSETDPSFTRTGTSILVGNGTYYVRVKNTSGTCTLRSISEVVDITSSLPPFVYDGATIRECDKLGLPSKNFDLATVTGYPAGSDYSVQYFETGSTTPVTSATINSGQTKTFSITVSTNPGVTPSCSFTKTFSISYLSFPPDNAIFTSEKLCPDVNSYSAAQFKTKFFAGTSFLIMFSTDGVNFTLTSVNPQTHPSVWVKISDTNFSCQSTVKLNFDFHPVVVANNPTTQLPPQCANPTETFDLASLIPEINADPNVTVTFHQNLPDAQSGVGAVALNFRGGLGVTTLYIRAVNNITGCVSADHPVINLLVYKKPALIAGSISKIQCEGSSVFNLTQNPADLVVADPEFTVTLEYYDQKGTLLSGSQISNYDEAVSGANPYIKVVYNPTCSDIVTFNLSYNPKPTAMITQIPICGEITFALQDFKDEVIANSSQYTFTDENGNPLPAAFDVSAGQLPNPVQFYMTDNATGCISDLQTVTFYAGAPTALLETETDYVLCATDFDGITVFNLDSKKSEFATDSTAQFEYFKDTGLSQAIPSAYTNETPFAQTVYARVTVPGYCPSIVKIYLEVNTPSKSTTLVDTYFICFGESATIDAGTENISWQWSTGETTRAIRISEPGIYSVILTNAAGCSYTHNFTVSDENQPKINVVNQTSNTIEVIAAGGELPYRYYFNGVPQGSNILVNPTEPYYEIQVESATGCVGPPKTVYFIKINNAFSPNGDGKNDVWKIENLDKMENVSLVIVDRLGMKVFQNEGSKTVEWDGKSGGHAVPTSTYWYTMTWFDPVTQKNEQRQGWILLKNRN